VRQRASESMDLFCRRAGVCRTATDVCNAAANLNCALCGLLDLACNFLCRGTLLFDSRCDRCGYFDICPIVALISLMAETDKLPIALLERLNCLPVGSPSQLKRR
jgi:hypothetical protein